MVFEFTTTAETFYSFDERNALRANLTPPTPSMLIWLGRYTGSHMCLSFGNHLGFDIDMVNEIVPMHAHSASMTLGQFAFQTLTVRAKARIYGTLEFPMLDIWRTRTTLIWPCTGPST